jgi:hypothetical protein
MIELIIARDDWIGGTTVSMLVWSGVEHTNDNKIGICFRSANHAVLRNKRKDWLARSLSEETYLPVDCYFSELVQRGHHHHFIECKLCSPSYNWQVAQLGLKQQSLASVVLWNALCTISLPPLQVSQRYWIEDVGSPDDRQNRKLQIELHDHHIKKWVNSDAHKGVSGSAPLMTCVTILTLPQK